MIKVLLGTGMLLLYMMFPLKNFALTMDKTVNSSSENVETSIEKEDRKLTDNNQSEKREDLPNNTSMQEDTTYSNKIIPEEIRPQAEKALSYYPELKDTPITFKFKKNIKKSTMQAQPKFSGIFKNRKKRGYVILISEKFQIEDDSFNILDVDDKVMIGWLGHELGHIMDYRDRSAIGMLIFGFKYLYSKAHIREVERSADAFAIKHGMADYIVATKNFILNNADISEIYKQRIRSLYLSPEEIMELVNTEKEKDIRKKVNEEIKEEMDQE